MSELIIPRHTTIYWSNPRNYSWIKRRKNNL